MRSNFLVSVNNLDEVKELEKVGFNTFLFALKEFSIGYENSFEIEEINKYPNSYVLINRLLNCDDVNSLRSLLPTLKVKGIVYEDIAVYQLVKKLNLNLELIFFQNHFGTNTKSINYWLNKGIESMFVGNELTFGEIEKIVENTVKPVVVQVLGYNQAMYSRRLLLSNYQEHFKLVKENCGLLEELNSKMKFRAIENKYGTVLYYGKIFNGYELLKIDNVKFYYINSSFLKVEEIANWLKTGQIENSDDGFLKRETIFKLKEQK